MATDERNFRSYYYEKMGFRGVEEKKSLEILLKDKPLDVIKLKQFCLRFPVPALHRNKVWKILLGSVYLCCARFVIFFLRGKNTPFLEFQVSYLHTRTVISGSGSRDRYNSVTSPMHLM